MTSARIDPMPLLPERPLLMLMDGHAMVHRAWHAIQSPLTLQSTSEDVRGVFAFANTFIRAIQEWRPTHCAIAFDMAAPTFRHIRFADYKAQRPATPPDLRNQFPWVKRMMETFNVPIFEVEEFEADDVLGTLCRQASELGMDTIILTGDTDTLQLVSPSVRVALNRSVQDRIIYDLAAVRERYGGLEPVQQPHVKALQGDASDNIRGVPGVGVKTAIKLIQDYGSIDGLYANLDGVAPPRIRTLLADHEAEAREGLVLTTIVDKVPVTLDMEASRFWSYDRERVVELLRELEFSSVVPRVPNPGDASEGSTPAVSQSTQGALIPASEEPQGDYRTVDSAEGLEALASELRAAGSFAFDVETTGRDPMAALLVGLSFSCAGGVAYYVPVGHDEGTQLTIDEALAILKPLLEDASVGKTAHNANYDMTVLANYGVNVRGMDFDTMVAAHLLGEKSLGLKNLAFTRLNVEMTHIDALIGTGRKQKTMAQVPVEDAAAYAAADADMTQRLRDLFGPPLMRESRLASVFADMEMPLVPVLVKMQRNGVALDAERLRRMAGALGERLAQVEEEVLGAVGHRFALNSTQQLADVLFNELRLPKSKRTKTGYSTDASVLEGLRVMIRGRAVDADPRAPQVLDGILGVPRAVQAQVDLRGLASAAGEPVDRARAHQLQPDGFGDGPRVQQRSQSPEHTGEDGARQGGAPRVRGRGRARPDAAGRRLLADRAEGACPLVRRPRTGGGIPARRGYPLGNGVAGVQRGAGRGDAGHEAHRQGDELRGHLRAERVWHLTADGPGPGRGRQVHRKLFRQIPGHPRLPGGDEGAGEEVGLPGDAERPPSIHPGGELAKLPHKAGGGAYGGQHAGTGHGGGRDQAGNGEHRPAHGGGGAALAHDTTGPR